MISFPENGIGWPLEMYQQSIKMHNVQYNPFMADGDSSAYIAVNKSRTYSPVVFIQKNMTT